MTLAFAIPLIDGLPQSGHSLAQSWGCKQHLQSDVMDPGRISGLARFR